MRIRNRHNLFLSTAISRARFKHPEGEGGDAGGGTPAPTPAPTPANAGAGGGNSGAPGSGESTNNNAGGGLDLASFWQGQGPAEPGSPDSGSASGDQSGSGTDELRTQLTERLNTLNFGEPVMTQEVFEQAQNGDFTGFQSALDGALRQAVQQSLGLSVAVLRPFAEQIMSEVRNEINQTLGQRDDSDQLIKDFPAAKDPNIRKAIQPIYEQALKNTEGDRSAAVQQVKGMLRLVTGSVADDLNLSVAPRSPDDRGRPPSAVNWVDELTARD